MSHYYLSNASLIKLVSFVYWNWMYFITVEHYRDKTPEWCSRVMALMHGVVAVAIASTQCKIRNFAPYYLTTRLLPCQYSLMVWSWGYFAFDLLWCMLYWSDNRVMLCHHGTALFAITRYMQKEHTGCTFACTVLVLELTNPLLQTRWFLKYSGYGNTKIYFLTEFLYLAMFLALRGVLGSIAMFWVLTTDFFDLEEKILSFILYVVSLIFIYDILGYVRYKYKNEIPQSSMSLRAEARLNCVIYLLEDCCSEQCLALEEEMTKENDQNVPRESVTVMDQGPDSAVTMVPQCSASGRPVFDQ